MGALTKGERAERLFPPCFWHPDLMCHSSGMQRFQPIREQTFFPFQSVFSSLSPSTGATFLRLQKHPTLQSCQFSFGISTQYYRSKPDYTVPCSVIAGKISADTICTLYYLISSLRRSIDIQLAVAASRRGATETAIIMPEKEATFIFVSSSSSSSSSERVSFAPSNLQQAGSKFLSAITVVSSVVQTRVRHTTTKTCHLSSGFLQYFLGKFFSNKGSFGGERKPNFYLS